MTREVVVAVQGIAVQGLKWNGRRGRSRRGWAMEGKCMEVLCVCSGLIWGMIDEAAKEELQKTWQGTRSKPQRRLRVRVKGSCPYPCGSETALHGIYPPLHIRGPAPTPAGQRQVRVGGLGSPMVSWLCQWNPNPNPIPYGLLAVPVGPVGPVGQEHSPPHLQGGPALGAAG